MRRTSVGTRNNCEKCLFCGFFIQSNENSCFSFFTYRIDWANSISHRDTFSSSSAREKENEVFSFRLLVNNGDTNAHKTNRVNPRKTSTLSSHVANEGDLFRLETTEKISRRIFFRNFFEIFVARSEKIRRANERTGGERQLLSDADRSTSIVKDFRQLVDVVSFS